MKTLLRMPFVLITVLMMGCSSNKTHISPVSEISSQPVTVVGQGSKANRAIPKAVIYRTNGDYNNNVPVNMNSERTVITSFPAPTDITSRSTPIDLGDGWLFDRRGGISINTSFLSYTYSQYSALKTTPSVGQLMQDVIPGSAVTQCISTPVSLNEAMSDPDILKQYIPR